MDLAVNLKELLHLPQSKKMFQEDLCPFGVPLCFLLFKKLVKSFSKFPNTLYKSPGLNQIVKVKLYYFHQKM